ncbi:hypothetical protein D3C81_542530 [compost metagenome]
MLGPGLGGVEQLVGETAAQLAELALHLRVTLLLIGRQVDTRQAEVTQGVFENSLLRDIEARRFRAGDQRFVSLEQLTVLAQFGGIRAQCRQAGLVGFTQLGAVAHRVEMADRAPGSAQAVVEFVHGQHQAGPAWILALGLEDVGNGSTVVGQDLFNRRLHMLGTDRREGRQVIRLQ